MENFPIDLKLTVADVNKVLAGLAFLPVNQALDLINNIKAQGDIQVTNAQPVTATAPVVEPVPEEAPAV